MLQRLNPRRATTGDLINGIPLAISALYSRIDANKMTSEDEIRKVRDSCTSLLSAYQNGDPQRLDLLVYVAELSRTLYLHTNNTDDLKRSITGRIDLLAHYTLSNDDKALILETLARDIFERFTAQSKPDIDDLEKAIKYLSDAYGIEGLSDRTKATILMRYGTALSVRFDMKGHIADLNTAIEYHRDAMKICTGPDKPTLSYCLGKDYLTLFENRENMMDLDTAIEYYKDALCIPHGSSTDVQAYTATTIDLNISTAFNLQLMLIGLANALALRNGINGDRGDIEAALNYYEAAIDLFEKDTSPLSNCMSDSNNPALQSSTKRKYALCLAAYVISVSKRCGEGFRSVNMKEAIEHGRKAIERGNKAITLLPQHHISLAGLWSALARLHVAARNVVYSDSAMVHGHSTGSEQSEQVWQMKLNQYYRMASHHETATIRERLSIAAEWARQSHIGQHATQEAYDMAMRLLDLCMATYSTIDSKHEFLTRASTQSVYTALASDAASFYIQKNDMRSLKRAVEILEQGRNFVWSSLRDYRQDLSRLRQYDAQKADEFETLSIQMEHLCIFCEQTDTFPLRVSGIDMARVFNQRLDELRRVRMEWQTVLDSIRENVAWDNFLTRPVFYKLIEAAADGPIVILNSGVYSCDALILRPDSLAAMSDPVKRVPLPSSDTIRKLITRFVDLRKASRIWSIRHAKAHVVWSKPKQSNETPTEVLSDMYRVIVEPILKELYTLDPSTTRMWWCPTGGMSCLPLHASIVPPERNSNIIPEKENPERALVVIPKHENPKPPLRPYMSYTPTLQALLNSQIQNESRDNPGILVVGVSKESNLPSLPGVVDECAALRHMSKAEVLINNEATHDMVLKALPHYSWIHLACHGLHHATEPYDSSFCLYDGFLSLRDIISARHENAGLAYLSACQTAVINADDISLPNEALHLSAAMQFCGFRSVIGTLWGVWDEDAVVVAKEFYAYLFRNGLDKVDLTESVEALSRAVDRLKVMVGPENVDRWASFVHLGI